MATKATTSTPKTKTASPKTRSKKSKADGATGNGSTATLPIATFQVNAEAFTVPTTPDPGPKRTRQGFAKIPNVLDLPDLIELQKASFKWFIGDGLREAFDSISPIKDFTGNLVLEFGEHSLGEPKYSVEECRERDMTYSAPLRVRVRLITA
ncbi:MAG: hypothetical protein ACREML_03455, partial [Vulcanimicrobiaceae bacterium]